MKEKLEVIKELFSFLWARRLWWMVPLVLVVLVFGGLVFLAQGSAVAPFVYVLF